MAGKRGRLVGGPRPPLAAEAAPPGFGGGIVGRGVDGGELLGQPLEDLDGLLREDGHLLEVPPHPDVAQGGVLEQVLHHHVVQEVGHHALFFLDLGEAVF